MKAIDVSNRIQATLRQHNVSKEKSNIHLTVYLDGVLRTNQVIFSGTEEETQNWLKERCFGSSSNEGLKQ